MGGSGPAGYTAGIYAARATVRNKNWCLDLKREETITTYASMLKIIIC